jgi:hypothetical protein
MNVNNVNEVHKLLDREVNTLRTYIAELEATNNDDNPSNTNGMKSDSTESAKEKVLQMKHLIILLSAVTICT